MTVNELREILKDITIPGNYDVRISYDGPDTYQEKLVQSIEVTISNPHGTGYILLSDEKENN